MWVCSDLWTIELIYQKHRHKLKTIRIILNIIFIEWTFRKKREFVPWLWIQWNLNWNTMSGTLWVSKFFIRIGYWTKLLMSKKSWSNFELLSENMGLIEENGRKVRRIHKIYRKDGDEMIKIYIFSSEPCKKTEQKKISLMPHLWCHHERENLFKAQSLAAQ